MRIAFVQSYPVYHDYYATADWLTLENRDRWMPGVAADLGHTVELWAGGQEGAAHLSRLEEVGDYAIRLFPSSGGRRTKFHTSTDLVAYSRSFDPDLVVLKGVDGGIGLRLLREHLRPESRRFAFVIGGKYYAREVADAAAVLYETAAQRDRLVSPGWRGWRRAVQPDRLIRLNKTVDTGRFKPMPEIEKKWDVLSVGRLDVRLKRYHEVGALSRHLRVAVAGTGRDEAMLRKMYPLVDWVGAVPNRDLPSVLNAAHVFAHAGDRDFFPRVIAEASACGLPVVAYSEAIACDVVPDDCGVRAAREKFADAVAALVADPDRCREFGRRARVYAEQNFGFSALRTSVNEMLQRIEAGDR
jgi:glycosyltransferase involved in cell wall biosynthesis